MESTLVSTVLVQCLAHLVSAQQMEVIFTIIPYKLS